jgi:hypothetical protein
MKVLGLAKDHSSAVNLTRNSAFGQGMPMIPTGGDQKWRLIAKPGGNGPPCLDQFASKLAPQIRAAAENGAQPWLVALAPRS